MFLSMALLSHDPSADVAIRDFLDAELRDYPSSRFRDVRAWSGDTPRGAEAIVVCGKVNSPNALGGFTGWTDFAVTGYWENGAWINKPAFLTKTERGMGLSEEQFIDALVGNGDLDAACRGDADRGEPFSFDPTKPK